MEKDDKIEVAPEEKPFLEHLEDLRRLFLKIFLAWGVFSLIAFLLAGRVFTLIQWPLQQVGADLGGAGKFVLRSLSPAEVFLASVKLSLLAGLIVALPLLLYLAARFILPALTPKERRYLLPAFTLGGGLFFGGVIFAYTVVLPLSLRFFWRYTERLGVSPEWTVQNYLSTAGKLLLGFGLVFEIPVVILLLAAMGIVNYKMLKEKRPYVIVAVFIVAALLTPPDIVTQILMVIPLLILFEVCLLVTRFIDRSG